MEMPPHTSTEADPGAIAVRISEHVAALCAVGMDRHPGTDRNRWAVDYAVDAMLELGLEVELLEFEVPEWRRSDAMVSIGDLEVRAQPGPFSAPLDAVGRLVVACCEEELAGVRVGGAVLLLHGSIAESQLTPRAYPWYANPEHAAILDTLDRLEPLAVIAATGRNPALTAALSPFPLIEDPAFGTPSAYISVEEGVVLLDHAGEPVSVRIDSGVVPSTGVQPVGRLAGTGEGRVIVGAHIDTKPDTPGALDNAGGVATLLAVAELLRSERTRLRRSVEFVPFNGEDHPQAPGEVAYLRARPHLSDVALMVNVDGAGFREGASVVSRYATNSAVDAAFSEALSQASNVVEGVQWPSSDHMIFVMRGIPAIAVTSQGFSKLWNEVAHTSADTPDLVDPSVLADAARFIAGVLRALDQCGPRLPDDL
jgi:aminopeptidase YwaD